MTELVETILAIFRDELNVEVGEPDLDVIESGLLDSLGLVALVVAIEHRCGVGIPFETLEVDDFRTVDSIARLVDRQQRASA